MTLNRQNNLLALLATIALIVVMIAMRHSFTEVARKTDHIIAAENTVKSVANFRFLIMETAFYNEQRSMEQWRHQVERFSKILETQHYEDPQKNSLVAREASNLQILVELYRRLATAGSSTISAFDSNDDFAKERTAATVSALFLATQNMQDDAFELTALNRQDLADAQNRTAIIILCSIAMLVILIITGSAIIKNVVLLPIAALTQGAQRVTKGDLGFRLNLPPSNEIGILATTFDQMTEELAQAQIVTQTTVQKLANKTVELTQIQHQLQTVIDHMPALVGSWDVNFCNRFGNRSYHEWFGISAENMRGKHMQDIIGPDRFEQLRPQLESVLKGNREIFERTIQYSNGEMRHALFSYVPDIENGVIKGFFGFISDISPLKKAQLKNEQVLAQLKSIVDAAKGFGIIASDENGYITLFSRGAELLLGYKAEEVVGKTRGEMFHLREEIVARGAELSERFGRKIRGLDAFVELARQGESDSHEWTYVQKNGTTIPVNLTVAAVRDEHGKISGYVGIAKDIQEDKKTLRILAETRDKAEAASLSKSQFLANMSHEIRTPMNAILGMLQLLQLTELSTRQLDYVVKTETAAQSLLNLLNDILDFSKVEANKMSLEAAPFNLENFMRDLSTILSSNIGDKDIEILFSMDPKLPAWIMGDMFRLRQILINLAGNAIKFTTRGEVITSLQVIEQEPSYTDILFVVQDSGIGIAVDQLTSIFEGFSQAEASTTRRFGGSGLGLAISQRLVTLMGGKLEVDSALGVGSRFYFTLRFAHAPDLDTPQFCVIPDFPPSALQRALVVDDNNSAREVLSSMTQSLGWGGDMANSGKQALEMIASRHIPYDVILVDWKMPEMDGWQLATQIRKQNTDGPRPTILMVTAHGREMLAAREHYDGNVIDGFLVKPITASMLFDAVKDSKLGTKVDVKIRTKRLTGLRLLVVEDTPMNQQVAQELLTDEGAIIELADSGLTGVQKVFSAKPVYDAVLMDIQMPDMDGYAATQIIRQNPRMKQLPIIAITANAMASDREASRAAGMNGHVAKPFDLDELVETILRYCKDAPPAVSSDTPPAAPDDSAEESRLQFNKALQRLGGNQTLFIKLAHCFEPDAMALVEDFRRHLQSQDVAAVAATMHSLKGIAGTIGAAQLAKYAAALELQFKNRNSDDLSDNSAEQMAQLELMANHATRSLLDFTQGLQPATPSSSQSAADKPPLIAILDSLQPLLKNANMQALSVFTELNNLYGQQLGADLTPLAQAMDRLDFKQALLCCDSIRTRFS